MGISISVIDNIKIHVGVVQHVGYVIQCEWKGSKWTVTRRFSEFYDLKTTLEKNNVLVSVPFPKKILTPSQDDVCRRQEMLDIFMKELCTVPMLEKVQVDLCLFLDWPPRDSRESISRISHSLTRSEFVMPAFLQDEANKNRNNKSPTRSTSCDNPTTATTLSLSSSSSNDSSLATDNNVPQEDVSTHHQNKALSALSAMYAQSAAAAARASFLVRRSSSASLVSNNYSKSMSHIIRNPANVTYELSSEGLILAIKNNASTTARNMLLKNPGLCHCRIGNKTNDTVLHLAVQLKANDISLALLAAGADPCAMNDENVSAMDVAPPSLKRRMVAVCLMALKTHTTGTEAEAADKKASLTRKTSRLQQRLARSQERKLGGNLKDQTKKNKVNNLSMQIMNGTVGMNASKKSSSTKPKTVCINEEGDDGNVREDEDDDEDYSDVDSAEEVETSERGGGLSKRASLSMMTKTGLAGHVAERYAAFVPRRVLPHLADMERAEARCGPLEGVVSFLDVAGFTKLTEKLAIQSDGAERLAKIINKLMGQMLNTLTTGDVIKFSGDAILVLYEPDESLVRSSGGEMPREQLKRVESMYVAPSAQEVLREEAEQRGRKSSVEGLHQFPLGGEDVFTGYNNEAGMVDAAYRAVSEGLKALHDDYTVSAEELGDPGGEGIKLALHVAITAGPLEMMHVGGVYGRWEVVMAGRAMQALGPTADNAPTNHLVVESECWALLEADAQSPRFEFDRLDAPNESYVRILSEPGKKTTYQRTTVISSNPLLSSVTNSQEEDEDVRTYDEGERPSLVASELVDPLNLANRPADLGVLLRYCPPVIARAVATGTLEAVSSFTESSVMFVGITGVDLATTRQDGTLWGQVIMATTQECVYDYEGAVNKFVMDDKGALLLCAWGLPPMAHVDDPRRATAAALQLASAMQDLGVKAHIGVTTGKVFAGVIGPPHRCEYSLLGDTVNLAARLMCRAPFGGVLCDERTWSIAKDNNVEFETLAPIQVKGKEGFQKIFKPITTTNSLSKTRPMSWARPRGQSKPRLLRANSFQSSHAVILQDGYIRSEEREKVSNMLETMFCGSKRGDRGAGGLVLLTGEAGSGKSELARQIVASTSRYNCRLVESITPKDMGTASQIAKRPCFEFSQVLKGLLSQDGVDGNLPKRRGSILGEKDHARTVRPTTVAAWRERLIECTGGQGEELACLFDEYFEEWVKVAETYAASSSSSASLVPSPTNQQQDSCNDGERNEAVIDWLSKDDDKEEDGGGESFKQSELSLKQREAIKLQEKLEREEYHNKLKKAKQEALKSAALLEKANQDTAMEKGVQTGLASLSMSASFGDETTSEDERRKSAMSKGATSAKEQMLLGIRKASKAQSAAEGRLQLLTMVLDRQLLSNRPLMVFIHVRSSSSLNGSHPEMWGLLRHLSDYAAVRRDMMLQNPTQSPLLVCLTHRRVMDFGGRLPFGATFAAIVKSAENCGGLLQIDPLNDRDRDHYLALSLRVTSVCSTLCDYVSNVANGNPQFIENCASAIDNDENSIMIRLPCLLDGSKDGDMEAVLNPNNGLENLNLLEKPPQIVGYVRQLLGLLSPQGKLAVQVLAHFHVHNQEKSHEFGDEMLLLTRNSLEQQSKSSSQDDQDDINTMKNDDDDIAQGINSNKNSFFKMIPKVNDDNYEDEEDDVNHHKTGDIDGGWGGGIEPFNSNMNKMKLFNVAEGRESEDSLRVRNQSTSLDRATTTSSSKDFLSNKPTINLTAPSVVNRGVSLDGAKPIRGSLLDHDSNGPLPTLPVLRRAFAAIAPIKETELRELLGRLAFYGLVDIHNDATETELESHKKHEKLPDNTLATNVSYYSLTYPLLQEMAADQLLQSQKLAIRKAIKNPRRITKRASM